MREIARMRANLKRFVRQVAADVPDALAKNGDELVATAQSLAADDSGRLKESGRHFEEVDRDGARGYVVFGKGTDTAEFDDVFYAGFEEFGTQNKPASPFLFPAYRNLRKRLKNRIKRTINKAAKTSVR